MCGAILHVSCTLLLFFLFFGRDKSATDIPFCINDSCGLVLVLFVCVSKFESKLYHQWGYIQRIETSWVEIHYPPIVSTGFESRQNVQRHSNHKKCTQTFASSFVKLSSLLVTWHRLSIVFIQSVYVWMFMLFQDSNESRSVWASNIICFFRCIVFHLLDIVMWLMLVAWLACANRLCWRTCVW